MRGMEHSTASQPSIPEPPRADDTETGRTEKAYGDRNFRPMTLPSLGGSGPILPEWLRKRFRHTDTPATR